MSIRSWLHTLFHGPFPPGKLLFPKCWRCQHLYGVAEPDRYATETMACACGEQVFLYGPYSFVFQRMGNWVKAHFGPGHGERPSADWFHQHCADRVSVAKIENPGRRLEIQITANRTATTWSEALPS